MNEVPFIEPTLMLSYVFLAISNIFTRQSLLPTRILLFAKCNDFPRPPISFVSYK